VKLRKMARCAMLAALMCLCAWISVPFGDVAVTMQTFALFLTLGLLGGKLGSLVCLLYLILGAVGLPVFSGFRGGLGVLLGATGGYIVGFLAASVVYWLITALLGQRFPVRLLGLLAGLAVCYGFGTLWFRYAYMDGGNSISLGLILAKCVLPYLIPDLAKMALAMTLTEKLRRFIIPSPGA